jgi:hypothetical protein
VTRRLCERGRCGSLFVGRSRLRVGNVASGLAVDGVTAVSFTVSGKAVQVPVENNVWVYSEPNSHAKGGQCVVAHLDDGSTVDPFPEVPCP